MSKIRVYVSFDIDHDRELFDQLCEDSRAPGSGFEVSSGSKHLSSDDHWRERVQRRVVESGQMIVICGEHTEASIGMSSELRIAQEEKIPYFLLWGRRDMMCTKPVGAKNSDGMYSWTREILRNQIAVTDRKAHQDSPAEALTRGAAAKR
jgi:hypothetical protein